MPWQFLTAWQRRGATVREASDNSSRGYDRYDGPALVKLHGTARILPAAALHHFPDHLFAKCKCLAVIGQLDLTGCFAAAVTENEQVIPHELKSHHLRRLGGGTSCGLLLLFHTEHFIDLAKENAWKVSNMEQRSRRPRAHTADITALSLAYFGDRECRAPA